MPLGIYKRKSLEERFWEKVNTKNDRGCWYWIANKNNKGYGQTSLNGKWLLAHRVSWEIHNGKIPEGLCVLHKCDTPLCVNPKHLWLGTQKDNIRDAIKKQRILVGEINRSAKLTTNQVKTIRELYTRRKKWPKAKITQKKIAEIFNVSESLISMVAQKKIW